MADIRMLEYRREQDIRVTVVGIGGDKVTPAEDTKSLGSVYLGPRALILKAYMILGEGIAQQATGSVSKWKVQLFDRKDDGSGTTQIGADIENTAALADDTLLDFVGDGYILAEDYVIGVERVCTDFGTSTAPDEYGITIVIRWIPAYDV